MPSYKTRVFNPPIESDLPTVDIPDQVAKKLKLKPGDTLVWTVESKKITVRKSGA